MGGRSGQGVRPAASRASEVTSFESQIVQNSFETAGFVHNGQLVFQKKGTAKQVSFTLGDLLAARTAAGQKDFSEMTMTHNHPTQPDGSIGGSFSEADISFFVRFKVGSFRAVDTKYAYELKGTSKMFAMDDRTARKKGSTLKGLLRKMYNQAARAERPKYSSFTEFNKEFRGEGLHKAMQRFAERYGDEIGFTYKRTER